MEPALRRHVLSVYLDLTHHEILQRCLKGNTQNANESFHSKVWGRTSKTKFVSLPTVKYSIAISVLQHNFGYEQAHMPENITQAAKKTTTACRQGEGKALTHSKVKKEKIRSNALKNRCNRLRAWQFLNETLRLRMIKPFISEG